MAVSGSENMRRIRSKNTAPERIVRALLQRLGFVGYRLHLKELLGKPDIVFIRRRKAILIHGCFWHGHDCNEGRPIPRTNRDYWIAKISGNRERDEIARRKLADLGWSTLIVWPCQLRNDQVVEEMLGNFLSVAR